MFLFPINYESNYPFRAKEMEKMEAHQKQMTNLK